jgi:ribonuclease-3
LGFVPGRIKIYKQALTHHSYFNTKKDKRKDNERLEFLGDAVLDSIVGDMLFKKFPFKGEGFLTEMRSKVVSRKTLSDLARKMGLIKHIRYHKSNSHNSAFINQISGNALEALFGAIYLDKGYHFTYKFCERRIFKLYIDINHLENEVISYKGKLFKWSQKEKKELLLPFTTQESGRKTVYTVTVEVEGEAISKHEHLSKKKAEELACKKACEILID